MPSFDLDLTDPTPDAVEAAMFKAVDTANQRCRVGLMPPDRAEYRRFLASHFSAPEGVAIWLAEKGRVAEFPPTPRATMLGLVWRTTPLGRRVRIVGRRIEPFKEHASNRFGPPWRNWPALCHLDPDHVILRTFKGGEPEMIAMCGCGAVGPPDKLGWVYGRCGPCHDHLEEHGRPLAESAGPPVLRTTGQLMSVGFLPSGDAVACREWVASREATKIAVWDRLTGEYCGDRPSTPSSSFSSREFSSGLAILGTYRSIWLVSSEKKAAMSYVTTPSCVTVGVHGTMAVALEYDGEVYRRDLTGEDEWVKCWASRRSSDEIYFSLAFAPDGKRVALGRTESEVELLDWPAAIGPTLRPPLEGEDAERPRVRALAFSPDGKLLAAGTSISGFVDDPREEWWGRGGGVYLYDSVKGELLKAIATPNDDIMAVAFSPDGSLLFYGSTNCQIHVLDVKTREEVCVLGGHVGGVNALCFSPDGDTLASAGGDGAVRLWPWRQLVQREEPQRGDRFAIGPADPARSASEPGKRRGKSRKR